jgi:hypothetical protein
VWDLRGRGKGQSEGRVRNEWEWGGGWVRGSKGVVNEEEGRKIEKCGEKEEQEGSEGEGNEGGGVGTREWGEKGRGRMECPCKREGKHNEDIEGREKHNVDNGQCGRGEA